MTDAEWKGEVTTTLQFIKQEILNMRKVYVTKDQFTPVKAIVYGGVGVILVGVLSAVLTLVIKGH